MLGLSQEKLGEAIGLTFQQVQKYERGANRIGSSRLFDLSRVLDVPVSFFFDEMPNHVSARSPAQVRASEAPMPGAAEESATYGADPMARRETLELVRAYYKIKDSAVRKKLFDMTKALGNAASQQD